MSKKNTEITIQPDKELLAQVQGNMPTESTFQRIMLPRLGMYSQDKTEGKGKAMKVIGEAGVFYIEHETDELDENGKKVWVKDEIGSSMEATIVYYRRQLSMYDSQAEKYTNSPVYDTDDELVPLFCDKKQINKGLPKDLKAIYQFTDPRDGKIKSKLQDNKILYILYKGEMYQMALKGTSMYSFMTYLRSAIPPTVLTSFNSEAKSSGATEWNMMTFKTLRQLDTEEVTKVLEMQQMIKGALAAEKAYYNSLNTDVETTPKEEEDWRPDAVRNSGKDIAVLGDRVEM